jgi:aryl-alcohol dehydrogenase-like predicted oxidoreductase
MRLNTDYLDLYQLHFPDDSTPLEETIRALDDLQRAGKIRYFGHSNFEAWRVVEADWIAREIGSSRFVTAQNQYSLLERLPEKELIPVLEKKTIGLLPYFPLASGLLTGKYRRGESAPQDSRAVVWKREERMLTPENFDRLDALTDFADEHGMSILDLAFAYLLSQPLVPSVIAGATSREQITANAAACERRLSQSDLEDLEKLLEAL